ncbi:acyltransferase family protein, partial [Chloroflexota bacterium]
EVAATQIASGATRLHYVDWLRVLAMCTIFFFHNARLYDSWGWHIKNIEVSRTAGIFIDFCNPWLMPLFFILAAASIYSAMKTRTAGGFAKERILRLLIPILILGFFVIGPPQVYLERVASGAFSGSFFQFYGTQYFSNGIYGLNDTGNFTLVPMHMWFLWLLFIFSLVLLPLFLYNKQTGQSHGSRLATLFEKPWTLVIPVVLIALSQSVVGLEGALTFGGGWNHLSYLVFFISGYLMFSNTRIQENIKRYALVALIAALVLLVLDYLAQFRVIKLNIPETTGAGIGIWTFLTLKSWCFLLAIIGFGSRYLNFNNRFLGYANEAVLPFYILHQTVIIIIGFFVIQLSTGIAPKYFIVATSSFVVIMVIYELLVKRVNILRFLFGMRWKKKVQ